VYEWPEWVVQDELRRKLDLQPAVAHYEQALALSPDNGAANRRLGQIELSLGEYEDALLHLQTAYKATPWDNATRQLLGEALIVNGRIEEGAEMWATVDRSNNQLDLRAFWYEYIGDSQRLAWVRAAIGE
jgi:tetratricopeptide (TPR) repeat protein